MSSYFLSILLLALTIANSKASLCDSNSRRCDADREENWTYRGFKGPWFWGFRYTDCFGLEQSPININTSRVENDENLAQLDLQNYGVPISEGKIENNGHTIEVIPGDGVQRTIFVNDTTYNLAQFHFHWGCDSSRGSEHAVDGKYYAMEMHLVHTSENNEIAVVGVFLEEQDEPNAELQKIVDQLPQVQYKDTEAELASTVNLNNLLPSNPVSYYRYQGSLTTPVCSDGVIWSVVPKPILVGRSQMEEFRKMYSATEENAADGCKLAENYRPVQPLFFRKVYLSQ